MSAPVITAGTRAAGVAITGTGMLSCLGDRDHTLDRIQQGAVGVRPLAGVDVDAVNVGFGYLIGDRIDADGGIHSWLATVIAAAVTEAGLDAARLAVPVIVGSGLRNLRGVESWHRERAELSAADLHFGATVRSVLPRATEVLTLSNACSAGGSALATGMDLIDTGQATRVVVAAVDTITDSMLAMIGRIGERRTERVQPFQTDRGGVLLGEGAVAVVLEAAGSAGRRRLATIRGVGQSCDAFHETAPAVSGIVEAIQDAHRRADVRPADVDLVLAHGTGTGLNDPAEASALTTVFDPAGGPRITAIKGAVGHTSGAAALMSLLVAVDALRRGCIPAVSGLTEPIPQAAGLRMVIGSPAPTTARIAQINAFGFGGVNAVTIVEV